MQQGTCLQQGTCASTSNHRASRSLPFTRAQSTQSSPAQNAPPSPAFYDAASRELPIHRRQTQYAGDLPIHRQQTQYDGGLPIHHRNTESNRPACHDSGLPIHHKTGMSLPIHRQQTQYDGGLRIHHRNTESNKTGMSLPIHHHPCACSKPPRHHSATPYTDPGPGPGRAGSAWVGPGRPGRVGPGRGGPA